MTIIEALSAEPKGLTFSEIVSQVKIEKSAVSRILTTLEQGGYVNRDSTTNVFSLGLRFIAIAFRHVDSIGFYDLCMPVLREVADKIGELVQLAVAERDGLTYVAKVEGSQRIRVLSLLGKQAVLHASTAGKVWLAGLPEERALALALKSGLTSFTEKTIRSIDEFRKELARVREQGFAIVEEEMFEGGSAVGVPIRDRGKEKVVGALVLSGPTFRLSKDRLLELVPDLTEAAQRLAEAWPPDVSVGSIQ